MQADLVIVVARTSTDPDNRRRGLILLVVEDGMPGFSRGRELDKMAARAFQVPGPGRRGGSRSGRRR